jgi:hydroxypyruvate reductase
MQLKLAPEAMDGAGRRLTVCCKELDLGEFDRTYAVAIGKASVPMAQGLVDLLGPGAISSGILVAPEDLLDLEPPIPGFLTIAAGHPVPDEGSFEAARVTLELLERCDSRSLVIFLLSGGASSLMELPLEPDIKLPDMQELYRLLVGCGVSIEEINAVRKHVSAVKGGRLAAAAPAAMKITLGVTDVPEGRESALGSGPTLPDPSTVSDACAVVQRYGLLAKLPSPLREKFGRPEAMAETFKPGDAVFRRNQFQLLLGMHDLFHHAHQFTQGHGFATECDNAADDWPLAKASDYLLGQIDRMRAANPGRRVALIADGEVSSPVTGTGMGGRNSAFVLECVPKIAGQRITVLSGGTDGRDGSSPAAGAVADGETLDRALAAGLDAADFARRSDSYHFFRALGDAIETGPTGNNLRDLRILLSE